MVKRLMRFTKTEMKKWTPRKRAKMERLATYEKVFTSKTWNDLYDIMKKRGE